MSQPAEKVVALLVLESLPQLRRLARGPQPAPLRPADQSPVEDERLPRAAGRRELGVGRAMALVIGDRLQAAADSDPHRRDGAVHNGSNGVDAGIRQVRIRAGTVNRNVVPRRSLAATQIRPPKERSTTRRHR